MDVGVTVGASACCVVLQLLKSLDYSLEDTTRVHDLITLFPKEKNEAYREERWICKTIYIFREEFKSSASGQEKMGLDLIKTEQNIWKQLFSDIGR